MAPNTGIETVSEPVLDTTSEETSEERIAREKAQAAAVAKRARKAAVWQRNVYLTEDGRGWADAYLRSEEVVRRLREKREHGQA